MANFIRQGIPGKWVGASTDAKPSTAPIGSTAWEYDTGKEFITYDGATWTLL